MDETQRAPMPEEKTDGVTRERRPAMDRESFPRFAADDGAGYTVRREDRRFVVVRIPTETADAPGATVPVDGPFESRHAAVAAAQAGARRGSGPL